LNDSVLAGCYFRQC